MPDPRHALGNAAENAVATWLTGVGWRILARRWRAPTCGEVDLVALDPTGVLVAIEVRARRTSRTGTALGSVDEGRPSRLRPKPHRVRHIERCAPRRAAHRRHQRRAGRRLAGHVANSTHARSRLTQAQPRTGASNARIEVTIGPCDGIHAMAIGRRLPLVVGGQGQVDVPACTGRGSAPAGGRRPRTFWRASWRSTGVPQHRVADPLGR